jgi:ATP-dependent Clp protease ATP-binding subunit ClpA
LLKNGIQVEFDKSVIDFIIEKNSAANEGARNIRRIISKNVFSGLAVKIADGSLAGGDRITISRQDLEPVKV